MFLNIYHPREIKSNPPPLSKNIDTIQFSLSPVYRRREGWGEDALSPFLSPSP
jgi:hypothetical protein